MTPTERIAAAIKPIIDEDRRADRERIAKFIPDAAAQVESAANEAKKQ